VGASGPFTKHFDATVVKGCLGRACSGGVRFATAWGLLAHLQNTFAATAAADW